MHGEIFSTLEKKGKQRGVLHFGLAIYIQKYLNAKEELWKLKLFHHAKIYNLSKESSKRNQNPSRYYYNSIKTNLSSFNTTQNIIFQKNPHLKIDLLLLLLLPREPKSIKLLLHSIMNLNTISLPCYARPTNKLCWKTFSVGTSMLEVD